VWCGFDYASVRLIVFRLSDHQAVNYFYAPGGLGDETRCGVMDLLLELYHTKVLLLCFTHRAHFI